MDELNLDSPHPGNEDEKSIPFDFNEENENTSISHSPLELGGNSNGQTAQKQKKQEPVAVAPVTNSSAKTEKTALSSEERITGMRTFFTKLHAGAIDFLSEQINDWLIDNPGIVIKRTNTVTGDVIGKKTEPNLIITVWY